MAAEILKGGIDKVWIDPNNLEEVSQAITKIDIRNLIKKGIIKKKKTNYQSRARARKILKQKKEGRKGGRGRKKGSVAKKKKEMWMKTVRALRRELKFMRERGELTPSNYRKLYKMVKGGFFRSKSHLKLYVKEKGE